MLGASKINIPMKVINTLKEWNQQENTMGSDYDKRVANALLLVCVAPEDLAAHKVNNHVRNLIFGKFYTRF